MTSLIVAELNVYICKVRRNTFLPWRFCSNWYVRGQDNTRWTPFFCFCLKAKVGRYAQKHEPFLTVWRPYEIQGFWLHKVWVSWCGAMDELSSVFDSMFWWRDGVLEWFCLPRARIQWSNAKTLYAISILVVVFMSCCTVRSWTVPFIGYLSYPSGCDCAAAAAHIRAV